MDKDKKGILYDVFNVDTGDWEDSTTLGEVEKEKLSFNESFDYYKAERDIARKLLVDSLIKTQRKIIKEHTK